jgi:hypothetical protein
VSIHKFLGLLVATSLCACAPLQQAPLVYASKIAVGIDISGTSTESPGISLTVGYKQVDAAYVPVAVAKPCDAAASPDAVPSPSCTHNIYALKTIVGDSNTQGSTRSGGSESEAREIINDFEVAVQRLSAAKGRSTTASEELTRLNTRRAELSARDEQFKKQKSALDQVNQQKSLLEAKKASSTISADEQKMLEQLESQSKASIAQPLTADEAKELAQVDSKIATASDGLKKVSAEIIPLQKQVDELRPQAKAAEQKLDSLTRKDAFSVYGRFEGKIGAESSKADVGLGKIFSTGVASQHLSQGLGDYYKNLGVVACYEAIAKLSEKISDATVLQTMLSECRTSTTASPK